MNVSVAEQQRHPWLQPLLRMHALVDAGVAAAVRSEERRRRLRRACGIGCAACCRAQTDIPVFQIELAGLSWYCAERLADPTREAVRANLLRHVRGTPPCPFLVDEACAVHPMRAMACRLFTVFGRRCAEGEDAFHERRSDVLTPPPGLLTRAYRLLLPFHGVVEPADQKAWLERGLVNTLALNLPDCDWSALARLMDAAAAGPRAAGTPPAAR